MSQLEVDLVIIDFDETLTPSEESTFKIENEVAVSMGFLPMSREAHQKNWGIHIEEAIKERIPGVDVKEFMTRLAVALAASAAKGDLDSIPLENLAALDNLIIRGKKLALLTSRVLDEARHLLDPAHVLSSRIERFYHKDNSDFCKPDPRVFLKPLQDFQLKPERAVYIGDFPGDGIAAAGAGLHFIASLEGGLRNEKDFQGIPVDAFVYKFPEILQIIR